MFLHQISELLDMAKQPTWSGGIQLMISMEIVLLAHKSTNIGALRKRPVRNHLPPMRFELKYKKVHHVWWLPSGTESFQTTHGLCGSYGGAGPPLAQYWLLCVS